MIELLYVNWLYGRLVHEVGKSFLVKHKDERAQENH